MRDHLLTVDQLGRDGIEEIMALSASFAEVASRSVRKVPTLRGKTVATLFFEDSTRTRVSFETAAKRLSADVLSFAAGSSSLKKGESIRDTVETIESMGIDVAIVRHPSAGVPAQVARWTRSASVVNAGDGWHAHPTQALLDCFTVRSVLGAERPFDDLRVTIVGDVRHSRVARSQVAAYRALGARVTLVGPATLLPEHPEALDVERTTCSLDEVLGETDVLSLLRVQSERGSGRFVPSMREYAAGYCLTPERARRLPEGAVVLHPGPVIRGVDVDARVLDLPNVHVLDQVANGVAVRMAVLYLMLGPGLGRGTGALDGELADAG